MNNSLGEIAEIIKNNNTFSIVPHINPDADAMGSCFAMKHILGRMGKKADVYVQEELPSYLSFLPGEVKIYENGGDADVCLCIDCGDMGRIDKRAQLLECAKITVNIDHHYSNSKYAQINHVDASSSSAGEICCALIAELGEEIDKAAADCLFCALCGDTGSFKYSNTSPKTLRMAADLVEKGADVAKISKAIFDTESFEAIKLKGEISSQAQTYADGLVGVVVLSEQMLSKYNVDGRDVDNIVDIARKIEGVEVAVSIKEAGEDVKVSLRSNEYIDVSKIAAKFGGGGHVRASGVIIKGKSLVEAKEAVIEEVVKAVKEYTK